MRRSETQGVTGRVRELAERFWFAPAPAARLAALRILIGLFALWMLWSRYSMFVRISGTDPNLFAPVGAASFLTAPVGVYLFEGILAATLLLNIAFVLGLFHRITGPLFAALLLWVLCYRNSWTMVYHSQNLLVLHVIVLGFTPAANALSLDAVLKRVERFRRLRFGAWPLAPSSTSWHYGWPVQLICGATVMAYFLAGVAKVAGPMGWSWAAGTTLQDQIIHDALRKELLADGATTLVYGLYGQTALFTLFAVATLIFELGAPLVLLHRRAGPFWAVGTVGMHWGIYFIMGITFEYPLCGIAFLAFFDLERLGGLVRRRRARLRRPAEVPEPEAVAI